MKDSELLMLAAGFQLGATFSYAVSLWSGPLGRTARVDSLRAERMLSADLFYLDFRAHRLSPRTWGQP